MFVGELEPVEIRGIELPLALDGVEHSLDLVFQDRLAVRLELVEIVGQSFILYSQLFPQVNELLPMVLYGLA